jgi:hypothetical protein
MKIKQDVASIYLGIEALSLDEKTLGLEETEIKKK